MSISKESFQCFAHTASVVTFEVIHRSTLFSSLLYIMYVYVCIFPLQLTAEVAQCKPISNIVDSMEIVACSFITDSVVRHQTSVCMDLFRYLYGEKYEF